MIPTVCISVSPRFEKLCWQSMDLYQNSMIYEQDAGVGLEVDTLRLLDNFQTLDGNVSLVA